MNGTVQIGVRHQLAVALRFRDHFTGAVINSPLQIQVDTLPYVVGAPQTPWRALPVTTDGTYRFVLNQREARPTGNVTVSVTSPTEEYVTDGPLSIPLPPVGTPAVRSSWLFEQDLWPTRRVRVPPGETAIVGRFSNGATVAGFQVFLFKEGTAPLKYARPDAQGEFLFRLPELKGDVTGTTVTSTADIGVQVLDLTNSPLTVLQPPGPAPNAFNVALGKLSVVTFSV
jgi:hypothetical protein